jgi:hypothetical protein
MPSPTDEDYKRIASKIAEDLPSYSTKDPASFFGSDAKNRLHNEVTEALKKQLSQKRTKAGKPYKIGDIHRYALVKHYNKLLPGLQDKLIDQGKVIPYTFNGQVKYRNASSKWTPEEDTVIKASYNDKSDKAIAKELGRSMHSVKRRREKLGFRKPRDSRWHTNKK